MTELETFQATQQIPGEPRRVDYEQFLVEADGQHVEWVDGEVIAMAPISDDHQFLAKLLLGTLDAFVAHNGAGVVLYEPFQMKTGPGLPGRSPDIIFVSSANRGRLKRTYLDGPADVAIEVVSPESGARDRGDKFYEYEKGGVREYWLIDPLRKQAEFYQLAADHLYRPADVRDGVFRSQVLTGFWLKVEWLWRVPLPTTVELLKALELI